MKHLALTNPQVEAVTSALSNHLDAGPDSDAEAVLVMLDAGYEFPAMSKVVAQARELAPSLEEYLEAGKPKPSEYSDQQQALLDAAIRLRDLIEEVIPRTTGHYLIEELRPKLRTFTNPDNRAFAGAVVTKDVKAREDV